MPNPSRDAARQMMQEIKATKIEDRLRKPSKSELLKRLMTENQVDKAYILDQYLNSVKEQNQQWKKGKIALSPKSNKSN